MSVGKIADDAAGVGRFLWDMDLCPASAKLPAGRAGGAEVGVVRAAQPGRAKSATSLGLGKNHDDGVAGTDVLHRHVAIGVSLARPADPLVPRTLRSGPGSSRRLAIDSDTHQAPGN